MHSLLFEFTALFFAEYIEEMVIKNYDKKI